MTDRPFPPDSYPVVVVGSGPGGLQVSYWLRELGVDHAVISADDAPGGMFRHYPLFQRLVTWTKPYPPVEPRSRFDQWYDWNSLLAVDAKNRGLVRDHMDGTSYFPSRPEMERGIVQFVEQTGLQVRYGCRWESTAHGDGGGFVLGTSDGEYRCQVAIFAVGMTVPWNPDTPGIELSSHYVDTRPAHEYAGKRVFIIGKHNSGFEIADALLPWARRLILASPRPAKISILSRSTAGARARYDQPYEDAILGGGVLVLDASIESIERTADGLRVRVEGTTHPGSMVFDVDEVIAGTGFSTPLHDLPDLGVETFYRGRLPAQTPYWGSPQVPGVYFAGSITQGSIGMKKYGIPSNSAAVHGFRYNARILAYHVAETHFGIEPDRLVVPADALVDHLLNEATGAPELWNQQSYLASTMLLDPARGMVDAGIRPLAPFVDDTAGPDGVAIAVETDDTGSIHPAVYLRRKGRVEEHLLPDEPTNDFLTDDHRKQLGAAVAGLLGG